MFSPDLCRHRCRQFIAIFMIGRIRCGVDTHVTVDINQPGGKPLALTVDGDSVSWRLQALADLAEQAGHDEYVGLLQQVT